MNYKTSFESLGALAESLPLSGCAWKKRDVFARTHARIQDCLSHDMEMLQRDTAFIFSTDDDVGNQTRLCIQMMRQWVLNDTEAPSLVALCLFAFENLEIKDQEHARLALLAGVLGEMENGLPYHSNMHYRKVLLQMIRLIVNHNEIYADTVKALDDRQICTLMAAAAIHDLGHDGKTNTLEGVHERARLELYSFEIFQYYMEIMGFDDPALQKVLRVMLTCTDVSPVENPRSPVQQMKAAYRWHFLGSADKAEPLNLSQDLKPLEKSPVLSIMALLLHEADIATSAGLDYTVTKYESGLIQQEISDGVAQPGHVLFFLEKICGRQMLSDAGQRLYAANLARIYALADKDYQRGNEQYPELMRSDFILGQSLSDFSGTNITLN